MKHLNFALAFLLSIVVLGCGAGHANLTSVTVSPESATTTSNPQGQVGYTATGHFANGKSRELSQVDGLSWKTSQTDTGGVAATIGATGEVTCSAPGTVTITASAPKNLSKIAIRLMLFAVREIRGRSSTEDSNNPESRIA